MSTATEFWDGVHANRPPSAPAPNARLTEVAGALAPGDALDLGCGGGGDALWLAGKGWRVRATDISATAVEHLTALARERGVADRVAAERHDLAGSFPTGRFDLVCAHYLHTPFDLDRAPVLRAAARALRPGGRLLVVDHGSAAPWSWGRDDDNPPPHEVAEELALDAARWEVERCESPTRVATGPGGQRAKVVDHVLLIRRTR
ncbi:class I SAM-dependent methyltransferase [Actinosynnema pretiosum]|uniref:SAM-dependent methyltransferase n=1 Tax=Actinosynnema pretiosum TaxID=42197 RepID=A0A290Z662_9PSEU|nr:class I SAM-dependent methyltransferase [Actinosynnema pretiosum]ATE54453.1 SAM-dependent methyltransferase [Actinosynnema pretiosum]